MLSETQTMRHYTKFTVTVSRHVRFFMNIINGLRPGIRYVNELAHSGDHAHRPPTILLSKPACLLKTQPESSFCVSSI